MDCFKFHLIVKQLQRANLLICGLSFKKKNGLPSTTFCKKISAGFTLIEFLIIVGIIGILVAVSIPTFRSFQPAFQLNGAVRNLVANLR